MHIALQPSHPQQCFFPFIPEIEVIIRQENWIKITTKKKPVSFSPKLELKTVLEQELPLPLFDLFEEAERISELYIHEEVKEDFAFENGNLSNEEIRIIHAALLKETLSRLKSTSCNVERAEILTWMYQSSIPDQVKRDRGNGIEVIHIPFTLGACCYLNGIDPYDVREKYMSYWTNFKNKQLSF